MEFVATAAIVLVVKKVVDAARMTFSKNFVGLVTQAASWVGGFLAALIGAHTPWGADIVVGGESLSDLNIWSLVLVGVSIGSAASTVHDVVAAVDTTGSSVDANPGTAPASFSPPTSPVMSPTVTVPAITSPSVPSPAPSASEDPTNLDIEAFDQ